MEPPRVCVMKFHHWQRDLLPMWFLCATQRFNFDAFCDPSVATKTWNSPLPNGQKHKKSPWFCCATKMPLALEGFLFWKRQHHLTLVVFSDIDLEKTWMALHDHETRWLVPLCHFFLGRWSQVKHTKLASWLLGEISDYHHGNLRCPESLPLKSLRRLPLP